MRYSKRNQFYSNDLTILTVRLLSIADVESDRSNSSFVVDHDALR